MIFALKKFKWGQFPKAILKFGYFNNLELILKIVKIMKLNICDGIMTLGHKKHCDQLLEIKNGEWVGRVKSYFKDCSQQ